MDARDIALISTDIDKKQDCQGTSLAVCTPLYTLLIIHIPPSFYFAYIHWLLFGYDLNLSCSQQITPLSHYYWNPPAYTSFCYFIQSLQTVYTLSPLTLQVALTVSDDDQLYADHNVRGMMLTNGKISFRTCMSYVRLHASYIIALTNRACHSTSNSGGPSTFREAFNFWFLTEILSAIGGHNML